MFLLIDLKCQLLPVTEKKMVRKPVNFVETLKFNGGFRFVDCIR